MTVSAIFGTPLSVTTLGGPGFGSASAYPATNLYAFSSVPRLSAIPASGKYFVNWGLAGTNLNTLTNNPLDWPVTTASPSFIARLANLPTNNFSLTTLINGQGSVQFSPFAPYYTNGTLVTLTATPASGQFFLGWSGDATNTLTNLTVVMDSSKVITASFGLLPPQFAFGAAAYGVNESAGTVALNVLHQGIAGQVSYSTVDSTAVGGNGNSGDYVTTGGTLFFTNGEPSKTITVGVRDNFLSGPDKSLQVVLNNSTGGTNSLGNPSVTTVTIHYNDTPTTNGSLLVQAFPGPVPDLSGSLQVTLLPGNIGGQWRFPWELGWRNSGDLVTNLAQDNYDIEFRQLVNYVIQPLPSQAVFTDSGPTQVTNQYIGFGETSLGAITVNLGPNTVTNGGWRFVGESSYRNSGTTVANLSPGTEIIEFKAVTNLSTPQTVEVPVHAGVTNTVTEYYLIAPPLPAGVALPVPLPALAGINSSVTNNPRLPYAFNGQLQTDVGTGSGAVVRDRVVLTAAHIVFNDETLSYVNPPNWFFQKETGEFDPKPQVARGVIALSGYAAARTNDLPPYGSLSPEESSPASRDYDAAAVYFANSVGRGGYGGYLSSDAPVNEWLTSTQAKMLVGYPMDGASFGYAGVAPGKMHCTVATNYNFTLQNDRVYASTDFLGFPGDSGGPVYVLCTNNIYYPAAVYLGTLGNASVVLAIDSSVVNLINQAAALGDNGTNFGNGGPVVWGGPNTPGFIPAIFQVNVSPQDAANRGAAWLATSYTGSTWIPASSQVYYPNCNQNCQTLTLQFSGVPGYTTPAPISTTLQAYLPGTAGPTNVINVTYALLPTPSSLAVPRRLANGGLQFTLVGNIGKVYSIQFSTNLTSWSDLPILLTNQNGTNFFTNTPPPGVGTGFYRAKEQ
jgi:hypothetical protein